MRENDNNSPFSSDNVCRILLRHGIISEGQRHEILHRSTAVQRKIERDRARASKEANPMPITIIDVILEIKLSRADDTTKELDEEIIYQTLAQEWGFNYKKIDPLQLDLNMVTGIIPQIFAKKHHVIPIELSDKNLTVAMANPFDVEVIEDIARVSQKKVTPVLSTRSDISRLINEFFGFKRSIAAAENQFSSANFDLGNLEQYLNIQSTDELPQNDQHIVNAVNHILSYAFEQRASDIHIEPKRDFCLVRMRIDGILHTVYSLPKKVHNAILSRIKTISRLDMAEKRRPQDGRIKTSKGNVEAEIRVSTIPVAFGEKVVMRIMDPDVLFQGLENLGMSDNDLQRYQKFIKMQHGIILVCGPTGSGKSTTLYSTLKYISTPDINITTVEDPIEMVHEEYNQIAVQPVIGITFGSILRNILRQDPDVIMIGEIRDLETGENAIQAALTGHLVLSTLHTNDAPSAITRLLDIGVPNFLIQPTIIGIIAQRLIRKICIHCKESFDIESEKLLGMGIATGIKGNITLHKGKGCLKCRNTGYRGRIAIFEILSYTDSIRKLTTHDTDQDAIRIKAQEEGMTTLRESAIDKLLKGITTYEEVLRVTWEQG